MPIWIVTHSDSLCKFLLPLLIGFSAAQGRHALNLIAALLVCGTLKHRTLAALTRLLRVPHADQYAAADFFRASPWEPGPVQHALTVFLLQTVAQIQARTGWRLLFVSVDDALCRKDMATHALEAVSLFYDHVFQRRQKGRYTNASHYVSLHLQLGLVQFALAWRLYLKRSQVKLLNRTRHQKGLPPLVFRKQTTLVEEMLAEIAPHLPAQCKVYVLYDVWYDGKQLHHFIRTHGWHWICGTRSNRVVNARPLCQWWIHLGQQRIQHVCVRSATRSHTYLVRHVTGRLRHYPDPVVALISKWDRRDRYPAYFLCSDVSLSVRTILKYYGYRWQAEVDNWFLKERFGLADYRLHSVDATRRWHTLVFAAYAFIQYRRIVPLLKNPTATLPGVHEALAQHQTEQMRQAVCYIAALARQGQSDQHILAELMPT